VSSRDSEPLVAVDGLSKRFPIAAGLFRKPTSFIHAVDDVSFRLGRGESLGLVGESGCGKTTVGKLLVKLLEPTEGSITYRFPAPAVGGHLAGSVEASNIRGRQLRVFRRQVQMIFQDPYESMNPRRTVYDTIAEPLVVQGVGDALGRLERVSEILNLVGLTPAGAFLFRRPHELSGGQRQRVGIARALALNPQFVVCDEPVSALDVSIQAQTLNLLQDLQEAFGLTYLFVAHQLNVVAHICDRVGVMYVGKLVEVADTETLYSSPLHPYTEALLGAVPHPDPDYRGHRTLLAGEIANPANPPSGCYFHPRCPYAVDECSREEPELRELQPGHFVKCHLAEELQLVGVDLEA